MSELFKTFLFDLQRFASTTVSNKEMPTDAGIFPEEYDKSAEAGAYYWADNESGILVKTTESGLLFGGSVTETVTPNGDEDGEDGVKAYIVNKVTTINLSGAATGATISEVNQSSAITLTKPPGKQAITIGTTNTTALTFGKAGGSSDIITIKKSSDSEVGATVSEVSMATKTTLAVKNMNITSCRN